MKTNTIESTVNRQTKAMKTTKTAKTMKTTKKVNNTPKGARGVRFSEILKELRVPTAEQVGVFLLMIVLGVAAIYTLTALWHVIEGAIGWLFPAGASCAMALVAGTEGGSHVDGEPLTLPVADAATPGLLTSEIDKRIVKIRPMSTPLDQISRYGGSRKCGSMKVEYYSVDTKPVSAHLTSGIAAQTDRDMNGSEMKPVALPTDRDGLFQRSTTILVPSVKTASGAPLVLYVVESDSKSTQVVPVNNVVNGVHMMPAIAEGTEVVRMGRAAAELDVCTPQFEAMPRKDYNLCQIFK